MNCPLCRLNQVAQVFQQSLAGYGERSYWHCDNCQLVFVPQCYHLEHHAEKKIYDHHQNSSVDEGYRSFLNRLLDPLLPRLNRRMRGLDFGAGPGPTLSVMLSEQGFSVADYDPIYANHKTLLEKKYDFVTATEVVEHLANPHQAFLQLKNLLYHPDGILGLMTSFRPSLQLLPTWHYMKDPTHICFYHEETLAWLAAWLDWDLEIPAKNLAIFSTGPE